MSPRYAENTSVSTEASRGEIERTLQRYGATAFAYGWKGTEAMIEFMTEDRRVRFILPLPNPNNTEFTQTPARGNLRSPEQARAAWEQACRQRWRALALAIKAKLEAVEAGIATFEDEFLAYVLLPNGQTMGQWSHPQIEEAYSTGKMPSFLPELGTGK